jgi:hypothetical protein
MSSHSRFGEQTIVNSFNLFIDTERTNICGDHSSSGDDTTIHFEGSSIIANDGELIKLTLTNFEMYNNLYSVDINNDRFTTTYSNNSLAIVPPATEAPALIFTSVDDRITNKNYATLGDMAIEFAKTIAKRITAIKPTIVRFKITIKNLFKNTAATNDDDKNTYSFTSTADNIFPNTIGAVCLSMSETSNRLLDIEIECRDTTDAALVHGLNALAIQSYASKGDFANLFGGLRQDDEASTSFQSFKTEFYNVGAVAAIPAVPAVGGVGGSPAVPAVVGTASGIRIKGFFPMQRTTDPYVYLRCNLSQSGGLESATLASDTIKSSSANSDLTASNILAKLKRDVEFISYDNNVGDEYFINLQQRKLSTIKLYLADSKNRPLGRRSDTDTGNKGTAAGLQKIVSGARVFDNQTQSTLGNLFFTAVLRVDIVKMSDVKKLETPPLPLPLPARKAQTGVVVFESYGMPKSGN